MLFGLLLSLLICESFLRLLVQAARPNSSIGFVRFMKQQPYNVLRVLQQDPLFRRVKDPSIGWELVPNAKRDFIRINSGGFRGPEAPLTPASGTYRIVFLGDSETFQERLKEEETVPGILEQILNSSQPEIKHEVLNFGVSGYNTAQEFAALRAKAIHYQPSLVVVYYVFNDPEIYTPISFVNEGAISRLYLYQFYKYMSQSLLSINDYRIKAGNLASYTISLHSSIYFEATKSVLREMSEYLAQRDIPLVLLIAPEVFEVKDFNRNYPYREIHEKLAALAGPNLMVVDPLPAMRENFSDPSRLWVTPFDPHKNADANRVIAEVMAKRILEVKQK